MKGKGMSGAWLGPCPPHLHPASRFSVLVP